jgi:hypothetical protein
MNTSDYCGFTNLKKNREFLKFCLEHNVYDNEYYIELYVNNDIEEIKKINIYTEDKRYLSSLVFDVVKSYLNLNNVLLKTQDCMKRKLNNMKKELKQKLENLDLDTREEKWNKSNIEKYKDLFYLYSILKKYGKNIILYIDEYYKKDVIKFDIDTDIFSGDKSKLPIYVLRNKEIIWTEN